MNIMEIILLLSGAFVFVLSFLIPDKSKNQMLNFSPDTAAVKKALESEIEDAKSRLQDNLDETLAYSVEKAERALERISNEKIMAVSEFSDTVLEQINANHKETIFLYDMLNDKQKEINSTARYVNKTVKESSRESASESSKADIINAAEQTQVFDQKQEQIQLNATKVPVFNTPEAPSEIIQEEAHTGNSNEKILSLYRQGQSKVAIAKELGLGVGEVKLVIDLFQGIQ